MSGGSVRRFGSYPDWSNLFYQMTVVKVISDELSWFFNFGLLINSIILILFLTFSILQTILHGNNLWWKDVIRRVTWFKLYFSLVYLLLPASLVISDDLVPGVDAGGRVFVKDMVDDITEDIEQRTDDEVDETWEITRLTTSTDVIHCKIFYQSETEARWWCSCHREETRPAPAPSPCLPD